MKVHKQKTKNRILVAIMCLSIVFGITSQPLKAQASKGEPSHYNETIIDIILTKTGIVASRDMIAYTSEMIETTMGEAIQAFNDWCINNSVEEVNVEEFYNFIRTSTENSVGQEVARLLNADIIDPEYIVECVEAYRNDIQYHVDLVKAYTGKEATSTENITLTDDVVDYVRTLFDLYIDLQADYIYLDTLKPSDVNIRWFSDKNHYDAMVNMVTNSEYPLRFTFYQSNKNQWFSTGEMNEYKINGFKVHALDKPFYIIREFATLGSDGFQYNFLLRGEDWNAYKAKGTELVGITLIVNDEYKPENIVNWTETELWFASSTLETFRNDYGETWIFTNDGRKVKVFRNIEAMQRHTVGKESYYVSDSYNDYNTTDNSVTVGGDYVTGGNYQYSHDVVQNEIDNSQNVDNSVVNNIVNNNQQTIINNYAGSVIPDNGNGGSDNGSGGGLGSILDGLGSIISAVADIVGFLLGVIGDVIGLIGQLFTVVFDGLKAIGALVGDFPKLLGDLFVFIPQELINFLVLAIEASVGIAIWRKFSKN